MMKEQTMAVIEKTTDELASDPVAASKADWNARNQTKIGLTFDELLARFARGDSHANIAKEAEVSRERIRQVYNRYFKHLPQFAGKSGMQIAKQRTLKRSDIIFNKAEKELFEQENVSDIISRARELGYGVSAVKQGSNSGVYKNLFLINGIFTKLYVFSNIWQPYNSKGRGYLHGGMKLDGEHELVIVYHVPSKNIFIVPMSEIRQCWGDEGYASFYIPLRRPDQVRSVFDWWRYHEAWGWFEKDK
jgi:hypothetical protein